MGNGQHGDQREKKQAQASAGIVTPLLAVGPHGKGSDQQKQENEKEDRVHLCALPALTCPLRSRDAILVLMR